MENSTWEVLYWSGPTVCIFHLFSLGHVQVGDPIDCSTPGFPVLHYLPEFAKTHVQWISDAIQPSHPLLPASLFAFSLSQHQGIFQRVTSSHLASAPVLSKNNQGWSALDWFDLLAVQGILKSLLQHQFESINALVLSLLYGPTLTSIHDYWKNHSFD